MKYPQKLVDKIEANKEKYDNQKYAEERREIDNMRFSDDDTASFSDEENYHNINEFMGPFNMNNAINMASANNDEFTAMMMQMMQMSGMPEIMEMVGALNGVNSNFMFEWS
jgi:hypothetical protein